MTRPHSDNNCGNAWPTDQCPADIGPVRMDCPGEFIAALPAMLGFLPERSLAAAVLRAVDGEPATAVIDLVVRFDLYHPDTGRPCDPETLAASAARICARPDVAGILAVVIDDTERMPESAPPHSHPVLDDLERRLGLAGIPVRAAWAVAEIAAGQPWWSLRDPYHSGYVLDPGSSLVAFNRALNGRPIGSRSRSDIEAVVTPDPVLHADVSAELANAATRANERQLEAEDCGDQRRYLQWQLHNVLRYVGNQQTGEQAPARAVAIIAVALRHHEVRDAVFALADSPHAEAAEQLWAQLTRSLPGQFRAEAAALLGYFAYVRGDGPLAGIALDAALDTDPRHRMAQLLHVALEAGIRPERLRDLARCGREAATDLGVTMPAA
ncbi:DUF4192 domain-containing protein [Nocardia carnea]|uniref:DUF4192 domain-containing protein n=1 Tax=Nocardia carnea TaxID=37328 RepID=UPI002456C6D3|nr:DUF4192 domain-containing protein [Nocardia carnea]